MVIASLWDRQVVIDEKNTAFDSASEAADLSQTATK